MNRIVSKETTIQHWNLRNTVEALTKDLFCCVHIEQAEILDAPGIFLIRFPTDVTENNCFVDEIMTNVRNRSTGCAHAKCLIVQMKNNFSVARAVIKKPCKVTGSVVCIQCAKSTFTSRKEVIEYNDM